MRERSHCRRCRAIPGGEATINSLIAPLVTRGKQEYGAPGRLKGNSPFGPGRFDCRYVSVPLHVAAFLLGALVLVSWGTDARLLPGLSAHLVFMKPFTGVFFTFTGAIGVCQAMWPEERRTLRFIVATMIFLLSALFAFENVSGERTGIDMLLFGRRVAAVDPSSSGMALGTSVAFLFISASFLAQLTGRYEIAAWMLLCPFCIGALALVGYGYGVRELYALGSLNALALFTAIGLCAASAAAWCSLRHNRMLQLIVSQTPHARALRRIGPPLILVPFLLGIVETQLVEESSMRPAAISAAITLVQIIILGALLAWHLLTVYREQELRTAAEEAVRVSEQKFRRIFETANEGIWVLDAEGRIEMVNPRIAEMLGYTEAEIVGKRKFDFVAPEDVPLAREQFDRRRRNLSEQFEVRLRHRDGHEVWASIAARPVFEQGTFTGVLDMITDITKRKHTELELARAQEQLQQHAQMLELRVAERTAALRETIIQLEAFSYSITHDMRGPLRAISGFAGILEQEYGAQLDGTAQSYLRRMAAAAQRLDSLIQDVLDFSRLSKGEMLLGRIDLAQLLDDIIHQYPNLSGHQAHIHVNCVDSHVRANLAALTQALSNLLGNALKFVAPGQQPEVRVECETVEDYVRIWIIDNGIGIAPEYVDRIWGAFQRLHQADEYAGTGIGLAIVKKAAERMGGRVGVQSTPGKGSRFWLDLPKA
jgi:PAS domain S-box-containing protein